MRMDGSRLGEVVMGEILFISVPFFFFKGGAGGWEGAGQTGSHNGSNRPESWRLKSQTGPFSSWLFRTGSSNNNRGSSFKRDSVATFTTWLSEFLHSATPVGAAPGVSAFLSSENLPKWRNDWKTFLCRQLGWCCSCFKCPCTVALVAFVGSW